MNPLKEMTVNSPFGPRDFMGFKFHNGVDLRARMGVPCHAIADGVVVVNKDNPTGYGLYIVIQHDGYCTLYAHLMKRGLPLGTKVEKGDVVAFTGNTGASTGPHLHFEIRLRDFGSGFFSRDNDGKMSGAVDPMIFLEDFQVDDLDQAIDVLVKNGIIDTPIYWSGNARKGETVDGEFAGLLIKRIANHLKT
jgi:murein DD-endopeptidase MepM/ murein hydrolase activator NlpD